MSYNGSGTFQINSAGEPVVTGTVISSTAFNALTADLATGLSTAITKDGQTTTTVRVPFAQGLSSTLVTDATSATTGSIITAGGISTQKALWVGTTSRLVGNVTASADIGCAGRVSAFQASLTAGGASAANTVTNFVGNSNSDNQNLIEFSVGQYQKTAMYITAPSNGAGFAASHVVFQTGAGTAGNITSTTTTTAYNATSDERLKDWENVPQTDYSTAIKALWVGDYTWKAHGEKGFGVRAQQAYATLGGLGITKPYEEAGTWSASAEPFGHLALWGVKDLYALVEKLSARVAELEAKL